MGRKLKPIEIPAPTPPNVERLAALARQRRAQLCETEVWAALTPILAKHRCRLATVQEIVNGNPGPIRIVVMALD